MFDFGKNWQAYLARTDIAENAQRMENSLREFVGERQIAEKTFLDIGCGSGLASLAAIRIGAAKVVSIDVSAASVSCTLGLRAREGVEASRWAVRQGSVLDEQFVSQLPESDIVYAWGVLHHTGDMRRAFEQVCGRVAPGGVFHTAIYNRVPSSPIWKTVKRVYNHQGPRRRTAMHTTWFLYNAMARAAGLQHPFRRERGMSVYFDAIDWLGGYPYEYATFDEVVSLVGQQGKFELLRERRDSGFGCNEFLFRRTEGPARPRFDAS